ncbi:MAG: ATP phosphoribosyltransferase regulatory subunit, partial [Clostridia bacterium]|nr:ATP phosphoribosyltransferase regulatory subunit [Clostridia bacterium]
GCGVEYVVDPHIVRGLDYYNGTVFEFTVDSIGAQSTVCGGGRYDGLLASIGGQDLPAVGFGMGLTRVIQALKDEDLVPETGSGAEVYIAPLGENAAAKAFVLAEELRRKGIAAETDVCGRSLKAQMKYADKTGVKQVIVIGDNELEQNEAEMKNIRTGDRVKVSLSIEDIIEKAGI